MVMKGGSDRSLNKLDGMVQFLDSSILPIGSGRRINLMIINSFEENLQEIFVKYLRSHRISARLTVPPKIPFAERSPHSGSIQEEKIQFF